MPLSLVSNATRVSQYPRQDSNLRSWLRRPVLYPLSYEGAPVAFRHHAQAEHCATRAGLHFRRDRSPGQPERVHTPDSVESAIHLGGDGFRRPPPAGPGLAGVTHPRRRPLRRDRTLPKAKSVDRSGHPGLSPGPPALLPWSPRLRAAVAGRHPRLPGELSPWPPGRCRPGGRSALCCGCRHAPSRLRAPACCFTGSTCVWQSGSSSGPKASGGSPSGLTGDRHAYVDL